MLHLVQPDIKSTPGASMHIGSSAIVPCHDLSPVHCTTRGNTRCNPLSCPESRSILDFTHTGGGPLVVTVRRYALSRPAGSESLHLPSNPASCPRGSRGLGQGLDESATLAWLEHCPRPPIHPVFRADWGSGTILDGHLQTRQTLLALGHQASSNSLTCAAGS